MATKKRSANEMQGSSSSLPAPFSSEKDYELFIIERDLLARIVLKQHCAYRRIDIIDRMKTVLKALDQCLQKPPQTRTAEIPHLRRVIERAAERFFQQLSMGLMIPMSTVCVGVLGRLLAILNRVNVDTATRTMPSSFSGHGYELDRDEGIPIDR